MGCSSNVEEASAERKGLGDLWEMTSGLVHPCMGFGCYCVGNWKPLQGDNISDILSCLSLGR